MRFKFIERIRGLFVKEPQGISLSLDEISEFLITYEKEALTAGEKERTRLLKQYTENLESVKDWLKVVDSAELRNPNISIKEKQVLDGNRATLLNSFDRFLSLLPQNDLNPPKILNLLDQTIQSTQRAATMLSDFFAHEIKDLMKAVHQFQQTVKSIDTIQDTINITTIKEAKEELQNIQTIKQETEHRKREIENLKQQEEKQKQKLNSAQKNLEEVKKTPQRAEAERLKEEHRKLIEQKETIEKNIYHHFSVIERSLRKYSKVAIENEKVITEYLDDPNKAFVKDVSLQIVNVLEKMKGQVIELEPKEKKQEKILDTIRELSKTFLETQQRKLAELGKQIQDMDLKIEMHPYEKTLTDAKENVKECEQELIAVQRVQEATEEKLQSLTTEKLVNNLEELLSKIKGEPVTIM